MEYLSCSGSICGIVDDVGHHSLLVFMTGVVVIQTLLGTVASDVFNLTYRNAGALQFLDNCSSGAVVCKLLLWARTLGGEFSFIVFTMSFMVFFPMGVFLYHTLVFGFSITTWQKDPEVFSSAGHFSKHFFNKATGQG